MLKYFISIFFISSIFWVNAQDEAVEETPQDSVIYEQPYGLRFGIDLSRPLLTFLNENYTGLEFVGDYRLTYKLYLAAELGNEKKTKQEDLYNFTTSGSYLKLGVDYNTYENWYGMNNSVHMGGRLAFSSFSQTLNNNSVFDNNRYWSPDDFVLGTTGPQEFEGLSAVWLEFVFGAKVELFANIFLGASVRMGYLLSNNEAEQFPNLWIPGFNKVTDNSGFGVGYNYSLTYFLPLYTKINKPKKKEAPIEE